MKGTYLEWNGRYSNSLFVGAEIQQGVLRVRVRGGRAAHKFLGIPVDVELPVAEIEWVEQFRHPVSRIKLTRVQTKQGVGAETYVFSQWVGEQLLAAGAPARRQAT